MEPSEKYLHKYKGCYFVPDLVTLDYLDSLEDFEIRDDDVFLVTYPKSGHQFGTEDADLLDRVPWLEYKFRNVDYDSRPSPRLFSSRLPYNLVPEGLRNGRAKVIYVARNPKDVLVSFYHFPQISVKTEKVDFGIFMEGFLASSWLDHREGWSAHRDDFNIIFITYEEMKKDLRSSILKICNFLGKRLAEEELDDVVDKASFDKMRVDHRTNYENVLPDLLDCSKGCCLRKGTIGDWKNMMTVTQSERFDSVFKERMEKLPFKFCWDIHEEI